MSTRVSYRFRANAQDSAGPEDRKSFLLATCEASSLQKLKTHPDFQGATEIRVWIDDAKPAAGWALLTDELLNTMVPEHPEGLILLVTPAAPPAADLATVHVKKSGKELPAFDVPVTHGIVNLKQVQQDESAIIEAVAVSDTADQVPDYQPLKHLSVPARAGQHLFIKAKSTGKPWLIKVLFP